VRDEAVEDVVRILPDRLGDDDGRLGVDRGEDGHALLLGGDEAVLFGGLVGMGADELVAERATAAVSCCSIASWPGQVFSLADWRRSPLATSRMVFFGDFFMTGYGLLDKIGGI
jgi:hypothetical protein